MNKGFTLIELSIVLIIVGLLVGGILVGQSLIESVKINRFVSDLKQYEVATNLFKNKFKFYPGDAPYFSPPGTGNNKLNYGAGGTIDADGDGSDFCGSGSNSAFSNFETTQVWAHLSQSGMLSKTYRAYSPPTCGGTDSNTRTSIAPYTELNSAAAQYIGNTKAVIGASKELPNDNFNFQFFVNSLVAPALQNKMGTTQLWNGEYNQVGLVRHIGSFGRCRAIIDCPDINAPYANMRYLLAP